MKKDGALTYKLLLPNDLRLFSSSNGQGQGQLFECASQYDVKEFDHEEVAYNPAIHWTHERVTFHLRLMSVPCHVEFCSAKSTACIHDRDIVMGKEKVEWS